MLKEPDFNYAINISSALLPSYMSWSIYQVTCPNKYAFPANGYRDGDVPGDVPQIKGWWTKYYIVITKRRPPDIGIYFYRVNKE